MTVGAVLGHGRYGKSEVRLVHVDRATPRHEIRDLTVSVALAGELEAAFVAGDNARVVPTDTQKNVVYAFARDGGVGEIEEFALRLARHFVAYEGVASARVGVARHGWRRVAADGRPHDHSFERVAGVRTTEAEVSDGETSVASGIEDLTVLKSTGSEFRGFLTDRYTTLEPTDDRILATDVRAHWRFGTLDVDWTASHEEARAAMVAAFAATYSHSLQYTMYAMGRAVLEARPEISEISFSLPNKHHILVDLTRFGLDNPGQVFYAADRPYGLIEGTVRRDDPTWRGRP